MLKWLLFLPAIAFIDPFLLYWVWPHLNIWAQAALLIVYPLAATLCLRAKTIQDGDMATRLLRSGLRVAVWYPGPISKILTLLLLLPPLERALAGFGTRHLMQHLLRGMGQAPGAPGRAPGVQQGTTPTGASDVEKLKKAKGRVVE